jgi:Rps23 Pro-64 3,4-dihydroxylase Tpa1-like proline 4-hydroxylase
MNNKEKQHIINKLTSSALDGEPFPHMVIDNFFPSHIAKSLSDEFPDYDDEMWFSYSNRIEYKKSSSDWRKFPKTTYQVFSFFNSRWILQTLSNLTDSLLIEDQGLHGGGWHIHSSGGKLNPHLDYSLHPMLGLQRKLNLIIYLSEDWQEEYGGHFGLWDQHPTELRANNLIKEIGIKFNRAVLFDTTKESWHGLSRKVKCPEGIYRKSLAVYYLTNANIETDPRSRALFSPTSEQLDDPNIRELIAKRSNFNQSKETYIEDK